MSFSTLIDQRFVSFAFELLLVGRHFLRKGFQGMRIKDQRRDNKSCDELERIVQLSD